MGIRGETVTDVSQRLLAHHGGLRGLFRLDVAELARVRGIGDAVPCEDEPDFGTQPLVSCDALTDDPDAQQALQGLYDHTRDEGIPMALIRAVTRQLPATVRATEQTNQTRSMGLRAREEATTKKRWTDLHRTGADGIGKHVTRRLP